MNCTRKCHHKYQIVTGVLGSCWSAGVQKREKQVPCSGNKQPANQRMSKRDLGEEQGNQEEFTLYTLPEGGGRQCELSCPPEYIPEQSYLSGCAEPNAFQRWGWGWGRVLVITQGASPTPHPRMIPQYPPWWLTIIIKPPVPTKMTKYHR